MEIEYAKLTATPAFIRPENKSYFYLDQNSKLFIDLYHEKDLYYLSKFESEKERIKLRYKCFNDKKCICGGVLRYIEFYDFWGCENYKNQSLAHMSYSGIDPIIYDVCVNVGTNWITDIIKTSGFSGKVKAKQLLEFYESLCLEDLRTKYGFNTTHELINRYIKTNRRSKEQEVECLEYLKTLYNKVVYQQCITYKIKDKKESFCIPDFICSNSSGVFVIDAKLNWVDDDKMDFYVSLLKFILKSNSDIRPVHGSHIMYEEEGLCQLKTSYALLLIPKK